GPEGLMGKGVEAKQLSALFDQLPRVVLGATEDVFDRRGLCRHSAGSRPRVGPRTRDEHRNKNQEGNDCGTKRKLVRHGSLGHWIASVSCCVRPLRPDGSAFSKVVYHPWQTTDASPPFRTRECQGRRVSNPKTGLNR